MASQWFDAHGPCRGRPHERFLDAELPGVVANVSVLPGAKIRPGQTIAMLESMKMEIPVVSENDGQIQQLLVAVGDAVAVGDPIAVIACCSG